MMHNLVDQIQSFDLNEDQKMIREILSKTS